MESIRKLLYEGSKINPIFDPTSTPEYIPAPLVIDLTIDVTNYTRIYHNNPDEVGDLLGQADAIVCDNEALVHIVRRCGVKGLIFSAPFGYCPTQDREQEGIMVGLLNHSADQVINNNMARQMLKKLNEQFLIYGDPIDGLEYELVEDFQDFAARCDVLVLPSARNSLNSLTAPLSVMMAGCAMIAANVGSYAGLGVSVGVRLVDPKATARVWKSTLDEVQRDIRRLETFKRFNAGYASKTSKESLAKITKLEARLQRVQALMPAA
jgi:hypothetical protein